MLKTVYTLCMRECFFHRTIFLAIFVMTLTGMPGRAQPNLLSLPLEAPEEWDATRIASSISNVIARATTELAGLPSGDAAMSPETAFQRERLQQIRKACEERLLLLWELEPRTAREPADLAAMLPAHDPPWSLQEVDQLRTRLRDRKAFLKEQQEVIDSAVEEVDFAKKKLGKQQQELRALQELKSPSPEQLSQQRQLPFDIRLQEQLAALQFLRLKLVRQQTRSLSAEIESIEELFSRIGRQVVFEAAAYEDLLIQLEAREGRLNRELEGVQRQLHREEIGTPTSERMREIRLHSLLAETLADELARIPEDRGSWERRYSLYQNTTGSSLRRQWETEARSALNRLNRLIRVREIRFGDLEAQEAPAGPEAGRIIERLRVAIASLERSRDLQQHLVDDCILLGQGTTLQGIWEETRNGIHNMWTAELFSVDERPVTIRKVVLAILLLLVGMRIARWLSQKMVQGAMRKAKVEENSIMAVTTLLYYGLVVLVAVIALGSAGIPLTLFTLLGGALAIGLGFGSQKIINNFISGLILLIERPIRVGDMIEVDSTHGRIVRVGLRCTQVRTFHNVDILVPNSLFLETNVINWTLTDDRSRGELFIGVAYGTDVDRVKDILLEVAREHPRVLKVPPCEVQFMDFGDNALVFRLYIWVKMRAPSDRDRVLSDLRFQIDKRFREENLVIAYPQRDVHLNTLSPLEVRVVDPTGAP